MSNQLSMAEILSIESLYRSGHSNREISRLLSVDRGTVNKFVRILKAGETASNSVASTEDSSSSSVSAECQNRPNPQTGSEGLESGFSGTVGVGWPVLEANPQTGSAETENGGQEPKKEEEELLRGEAGSACTADPVPLNAPPDASRHDESPPHWDRESRPVTPPVRSGPASLCKSHGEVISRKFEQGLSVQRIHQDLRAEHGFTGSYHSVRRYLLSRGAQVPLPFRRMEVGPGEEAQIDFGTAAPVLLENGKRRRPWMFRIVLSCSRKAYSEVVWHQTTDNFIAAIENAFQYFGGVPKSLVIDNLKAAVKQADWYDPEIHPKLQSFAAHYGTAFLPTKPYTPQHKGKVESGVKYAKNNALAGHTFSSLFAQNAHLLEWEEHVADTRIHGTTKQQVRLRFETLERGALLPLPRDRFAQFHEARRAVSRDGHLEVAKSYYSAPPEYIGRRVWVRWDARLLRVFNDQWKQIAIHCRVDPGRFQTDSAHIPSKKVSAVERGTDALLRQIAIIGPHAQAWSEFVIQTRGVEGVRVLVGLKALARKHRSEALERACHTAVGYGACRLKSVRNLLKHPARETPQELPFLEEHPIIRPLADYSLDSLNQFRKERHERDTP